MTSTPSIQTISDFSKDLQGYITTGDRYLDDALGGGILPGTITEFVGASSAGRTQLALQLSLMVQLPRSKGGLDGSACYITTNDTLRTSRLIEIKSNHPQLSTLSMAEALSRIETVVTDNLPKLVHVLETAIHRVRLKLADRGCSLRLLVVDSIDFVFKGYTKTTARTLFERSKDITNVSLLLHRLASEYDLAILVINGVHDVFASNKSFASDQTDAVIYLDQARWFGRGDGISADGSVEAALGLVWANQIGTRVMLTRTGRRRKHISEAVESKRRLISSNDVHAISSLPSAPLSSSAVETGNADAEETVLIRQFSVVFSQSAPPATVDYIITSAGVFSLQGGL